MERVARTREPQKLNYAQNPAAGSLLAAPAGGRAEAEFDFINDSPDVAAFELAVSGLPADWTTGVGPDSGTMAAASGGGALRLILTPPLTASVGEYDFSVRILSGGDPIAPATVLILRVEPPDEAALAAALQAASDPPPLPAEPVTGGAVVFAPEPAPIAADVAAPEPVVAVKPKPAPRRRVPDPPVVEEAAPILESPPPPIIDAPPPIVEEAAPVLPEPPPPAVPPPPAPVVVPPPPPPVVVAPPPPPPPVFAAPPPVPRMPDPTPPPAPSRPLAAAPVVEAPAPVARPVPRPRPAAPPPPPEEEPVVVVDYQPTPTRLPADQEDEDAPPEQEPSVVDLADGGAVALKPGETRLLRFTFTNDQSRETTYVLDEDRSLPDDWITLVQDQVNLTRNGQGDVSLRLSPPLNAEPGDYPFGVTLGPQGGVLTPRSLTLTVQATPAVKLTSKEKTVKIGAMGSFADFHLSAESAGNADTAFRVAVLAPPSDSAGSGRAPLPVYGTPQWRYLFDKELETLRSPGSGRAPRPVPIRFRLQRTGPWWFGFRETHQVRVAAVPVTDVGNGGKPENAVEVTAVRQRFWPMPYLTIIPLLLLLMALGSGGAEDLSVTDAQHQENDAYWVVNPPDKTEKTTTLTWQASPTTLLRVTGEKVSGDQAAVGGAAGTSQVVRGSGSLVCQASVKREEPDVEYHYKVSRLIGGGDRDVFVHYVFTRGDTPLKVQYQDVGHASYTAAAGPEITLTVPKSGYAHLNLTNGAKTYNDVDYWIVRQPHPDTSAFEVQSIDPKGTIEQGRSKTPVIRLTGHDDADDNKIVLVTSDADRPILTVTLKKQGGSE